MVRNNVCRKQFGLLSHLAFVIGASIAILNEADATICTRLNDSIARTCDRDHTPVAGADDSRGIDCIFRLGCASIDPLAVSLSPWQFAPRAAC